MRRIFLVGLVAIAACSDEPGGGGQPDATVDSDGRVIGDDGAVDPDALAPMDARVSDPNANDNATRDTDCDGISDAEELGTIWPTGNEDRS